jgi:3-phenylpropionate/trans-cinnamate dioxygenase ferredoxin subunit
LIIPNLRIFIVFHFACDLASLTSNQPKTLEIDDRFVVITLIDGEVYCIEDLCTHDGGTLGDGEVDGNCIACPRHGAKFDLRTGNALTMPATEATSSHEVKVEDGKVYIQLVD